MDKQTAKYLYHGILFSNRKKSIINLSHGIDESQNNYSWVNPEHHVKRKKPDIYTVTHKHTHIHQGYLRIYGPPYLISNR